VRVCGGVDIFAPTWSSFRLCCLLDTYLFAMIIKKHY